jgi:universal stress protein A
MKTRILFPVDFSTGDTQALQLAVSLARDHQGELVLLHVEEPPMAYGGGEFYYGLLEPARPQLVKMLDEVVVSDPKLSVQRHVVMGSPASAIVSFAEQYDIDYIVMPTHGRTGLNRLLMGSVAEAVVRKAPCPVLTVNCTAVQLPKPPNAKELSHV